MRVKLDKVCKRIYAGGDVPKDRYSTVKTAEYAIPIYANAEKDNGLYGYTDTARENELSITVAARGTIGFTAIRREPFLPVVRLITVVPDLSTVSERYLYYALRNCKPASSGTSIPQLTVPDIKKNEIELYSLSVQETIADKLDAVGGVIELRQQQLQKLDELVKARFVELFGNFVYERDRWSTCKIGDISDTIDPQPSHRTPPVSLDGIPYIGIAECNYKTLQIDFANARKVGQDVLQEHLNRYILDKGDFIIGKIGTIGKPFFLPVKQTYTLSANTVLIKPNKLRVEPQFLFAVFQSEYMERIIDAEKKSTSQPAFGIQKVRKIDIPMPPLELQQLFAAFVEQANKSKVTVQKALDEAQLLFGSLMQKYFG